MGWLVAVTGVPGAGKTTLATALATALKAPYLSLDAIKECLHLAADEALDRYELRLAAERQLVMALSDAEPLVVVDIWIAPRRDTRRVVQLFQQTDRAVFEVLCRVPAEVAVERYTRRKRAGPHLPADEPTLQRIREAARVIQPMAIGPSVEVDTSRAVNLGWLAEQAQQRMRLQ